MDAVHVPLLWLVGGEIMASQAEARDREQHARKRILALLILAAALPVLPAGMFAGLALAVVIAVWLYATRMALNAPILCVLTAIVVSENLVFIAGALR